MASNTHIQISINRNVSIAILLSLLVHIALLFVLSQSDVLSPRPPSAEKRQTLNVVLVPPTVEPQEKASKKSKKSKWHKEKSTKRSKSESRSKSQQAQAEPPPVPPKELPATQTTPPPAPTVPNAQTKTVPPKPAAPPTEKFTDLDSYMKAAKERRRLAGDPSALNEDAAAQEASDEITRSKRNFQPAGTNGIFNILRLNNQSATFDFRGWKNEFSYARREVYAVDADRNTDIHRAVVRKMIEIIRHYYQGDFNWDSPRLGQVVVLSARPKDNAFLEDFLLQEFFGSRGVSAQ